MKINFEIEAIEHFDSPMAIFEDYAREQLESMTADEKDFLDCIDDFEPFDYVVFNYEKVVICDEITGDIIGVDSIDEFIKQTVEYIAENL